MAKSEEERIEDAVKELRNQLGTVHRNIAHEDETTLKLAMKAVLKAVDEERPKWPTDQMLQKIGFVYPTEYNRATVRDALKKDPLFSALVAYFTRGRSLLTYEETKRKLKEAGLID